MKRLILALVLLWPVAGLADFDAGFDAYERGDFATAMREWRPLAEQGYAAAQFNLGIMYDNGQGVPEHDAEAAKWYRLAAEQGDADAQIRLSLKHAKGEGVPEDSVQAYAWLNLAAAQGNMDASKNKGLIRKLMTREQVAEAQKLSRKLCANIPNCLRGASLASMPKSSKQKSMTEQRKQEAALAMQAALAAEQAELARAGDRTMIDLQSEYMRQITATVERNWLRPKSVPNGLEVKLQVSQIPGGTVVNVSVLKSSGNVAFDRSAVLAVHKSSPLPRPKDNRLFQREVILDFQPDN